MAENELSFVVDESPVASTQFKRDNVVRQYSEDNKLNFPLLMLSCDKVELFRIEALRGMLRQPNYLGVGDGFNVYIDIQGSLVGIGILDGRLLKSFLSNKVFSSFIKKVMLSEEDVIVGDMMFALCKVSNT